MLDRDFKAFIEERIEEAEQKKSVRREQENFRDRALRSSVCPTCGGRLIKKDGFLEFFHCTARYSCIECGAKYERYYGD